MAEVLITLGIIGVVAALTIPTLMANYQKQKTVTQLKKAYSEIGQALKLAEAEYGNMDGWSYSVLPGDDVPAKYTYFVQNYVLKYLKTAKVCIGVDDLTNCSFDVFKRYNDTNITGGGGAFIYAIISSGYGILFWGGGGPSDSLYSPHMHFYVDVNGPRQGANTIGKDVFVMSANMGAQHAVNSVEHSPKKSGFWMYGAGWEPALTRDQLISESCNKNGTGSYCGALIQMDGWEIAPDYPW